MKSKFNLLLILSAFILLFTSCNEDLDRYPSKQVKGAYILNFGTFMDGGASITKWNEESNELVNLYYQNQNEGMELLSNINYIYEYQDSIYLLGNYSDQLITVNPLFQQTQNGVSEGLTEPRTCVAANGYLYISCWGNTNDNTQRPNSYLAKFDMAQKKVVSTIALPGGPEGLVVANEKLYAAMNYIDSVAVIDLRDETVNYIATPAVSSYFIKDQNENLYVSLVSTFSNFSTETGLGYINTESDQLEELHKLDGISDGYGSIIAADEAVSEIYVVAASWVQLEDESWVQEGAAYKFDVMTGTFAVFAEDLTGLSGISLNPHSEQVYAMITPNATEPGLVKVYEKDGTFVEEIVCGINPTRMVYLE